LNEEVRTTIDIDEAVLRTAKQIAQANKQSIGRVLSDLARKGLRPEPFEGTIRNGIPQLPSRPDLPPITNEMVRELLDQE
jgi:hypothetical protein